MALAISPTTTAIAGTSATSGKVTAKKTTSTKVNKAPKSDIRNTGVDYNGGKPLPFIGSMKQAREFNANAKALAADAPIGTVAQWLALDDINGIYRKDFVLKGVGEHIQIWVASDAAGNEALEFPTGDCRNTMGGGAAVTVTQTQVDSFVAEFDNNMFPKESEAFSVAPDRDGTNGAEGQDGPGEKTVTLVDNVRDANFYTPATPDGQTYIAGFFFSLFNDLTDRNIMTIDSFDWLHRTGATPPDDTATADYAACFAAIGGSRPFGMPRPRLYEGTFAHEYQHLLESYVDADEDSWINEGLSDWAQSLVGYVDTNKPGTDPTADGHISCFQGFLGENFGGPENSLTEWEDQGGPEVLCDYGAAYSMMEYLHGRFGGDAFMSKLHKEPLNGLAGLQKVIDESGFTANAQDVVHNWQAMMALDSRLDGGSKLTGGSKALHTSPTLNSAINWDSPQAFESPGAPPNGADYVRLRKANGTFVHSKNLQSISFKGAGTYTPAPVEWTVQDGRLFSGAADNLDRGISREIAVPSDPSQAVLSADLEWGTELGWDFAFVQVFDPATGKYTSLTDNEGNTTSEHDPGADSAIVANLPGFTGPAGDGRTSSGVKAETFDLSPWAGQTVEIAFRYMADGGVTGLGYWVDNVKVGGTTISDGTDLGAWQSLEQAHPTAVDGWTVQLVGFPTKTKRTFITRLPVTQNADGDFVATVNRSIRAKIGNASSLVGAIVTADDPTESAPSYPDYTLTVNGVVQPGGS
jgi:hypothetical protein